MQIHVRKPTLLRHVVLDIVRDYHVLVGADLLYSSRYLPMLVRVSIVYHTIRSLPVCLTRSSPSATEATRIHPSSCPPRGVQLEPQQLSTQEAIRLRRAGSRPWLRSARRWEDLGGSASPRTEAVDGHAIAKSKLCQM